MKNQKSETSPRPRHPDPQQTMSNIFYRAGITVLGGETKKRGRTEPVKKTEKQA